MNSSYSWTLITLLWHEVRSRYVGSVSGLLWVIFHPIALLAIYSVVIQHVFHFRVAGLGGVRFVMFVAMGLWPWQAFQEGLLRGTLAITKNAPLVKKVAFPNELLVYSAVAGSYLIHMVGFLAVLLVMGFYVHLHWVMLPVVVALMAVQMVLTVAMTMLIAPMQVIFRDVEQIMTPVLMIAFYAVPVLYPIQLAPSWLRPLLWLNPMTYFMEKMRAAMLNGVVALHWTDLAMFAGCLIVAWLSVRFFRRLSMYFEDFL